jgi:hypothetical protein
VLIVSAINEVYSLLSSSQELISKLAKSSLTGPSGEQLPAIYDSWPGDNATMPYILLSWQLPEGIHWGQVRASLDIDVFDNTADSTKAEAIKDICLQLLHYEVIKTEEDGDIRVYFGGNDAQILEPELEVVHWNINFMVKYWRQKLIAAVTNK